MENSNRIIKFRAWHFGLKEMISSEEMTSDQMAILPDGHFANINGSDTRLSQIFSHNQMLPLQFTGLCDKDGKEIYEGDIVSFWDEYERENTFKVEFSVDGLKKVEEAVYYCGIVIGNIYEDGELLNPKETKE